MCFKYILQYDIMLFPYRIPRAPVLLFRYVALCLLAVIVKVLLTKSCAETNRSLILTIHKVRIFKKNILEPWVIMAQVRDCIRRILASIVFYFEKIESSWTKIISTLTIGILLPKLFWNIVRIWGWRPRICKIFEITRTIYSNSERSEQFLVKGWFFLT